MAHVCRPPLDTYADVMAWCAHVQPLTQMRDALVTIYDVFLHDPELQTAHPELYEMVGILTGSMLWTIVLTREVSHDEDAWAGVIAKYQTLQTHINRFSEAAMRTDREVESK